MKENHRVFENKSLFLKETRMFLGFDSRVQRILSIKTRFDGITRVFTELSSILSKTSCSDGE